MATNTVNRQVNIFIESGQAEKAFTRLQTKAQGLEASLRAATNPAEAARLRQELDRLSEPLDRARRRLSGELSPSFRDLQQTVTALGNRLRQMSQEDADFSKVLLQYQQARVSLQEMTRYGRQLSEAQREISRGGGSSSFGASFFGNFTANIATNVIQKLKDIGTESVQLALQGEGIRNAFNRLDNPDLLQNLRAATRGTVSDLELMKRAVQANNFQIPLETLGTLLSFAQRRARETGESVDYLVESIVTGIARKSPLILDNLGINITRIQKEFEKTGDFAKAAMIVVEQELAKAGDAVVTNADKVDMLLAKWQNFKESIGVALFDSFAGIQSALENEFNAFDYVFSSEEERAQKRDAARKQQQLTEDKRFRDNEISILNEYKKQYAAADQKGRDKIQAQVKAEISATNQAEAIARLQGYYQLADQLKDKLDLWQNYLNNVSSAVPKGDTIAALQKEIQLTEQIRDNAEINSKTFKDSQDKLKTLQDRLDALLGKKKSGGTGPKENLFKKFTEDLNQTIAELDAANKSQFDRELVANEKKYDALNRQFAKALKDKQLKNDQYNKLVAGGEDLRMRERLLIVEREEKRIRDLQFKYEIERADERRKKRDDDSKKASDLMEARMKEALERQYRLAERLTALAQFQIGEQQSAIELRILKSNGQKKLRAQLDLLELQKKQEIAAAGNRVNQVALIEEQYRKKERELKIQSIAGQILEVTEFLGQQLQTIQAFDQQRAAKENAALDRDRNINDQKKRNYENQLNKGIITREEYDRKISAIDNRQQTREREIARKQFQRNKLISLAQAAINIAEAVTKSLTSQPFPLNVILAAATGAAGYFQLREIAKSKPPEFAKGGVFLEGPSHREGGMPIINPRTGRKVAEIEGGEVILSRRTVSNNPGLVSNLLHSSMHRNGATLSPQWMHSKMSFMNFTGIANSMSRLKFFESGGVFPASKPAADQDTQLNLEVLSDLTTVISALSQQLANGITAPVVLTDLERQQVRLNAIRQDATGR